MKQLIFILSFFICLSVKAQTYNPAFFNPSNTATGYAQKSPADGRSMYFNNTYSKFRDFASRTEVITYFTQNKFKFGHYPVFIHRGGTIQNDTAWLGGTTDIYWFRDSTDLNSLVLWNDVQTVNGQRGVVVIGNADSIRGRTVDTTVASGSKSNYLLAYDSTNNKWKLTAPASAYTSGTGMSIANNVISALNTSALWNAVQIRSRSVTTANPSVGQILKWSGTSIDWAADNSSLDTAYISGYSLYLVGTSDTVIVALNDLYLDNTSYNIGGDSTSTIHFQIQKSDEVDKRTVQDILLDKIELSSNNIHYSQVQIQPDSVKLVYNNNGLLRREIKLDTTDIAITDNIDSIGVVGKNLSTTKILANDTAYTRVREVKKIVGDSSGNYIRNDTTIVQNGGFKLGAGSKMIGDSLFAYKNSYIRSLSLGDSINSDRHRAIYNLLAEPIIQARLDTTNPIAAGKEDIVAESFVQFTTAPSNIDFQNFGINGSALIHKTNTQDIGRLNRNESNLVGVFGTTGNESGAGGTVYKSSGFFSKVSHYAPMVIEEGIGYNSYRNGDGIINHYNGLRISNISYPYNNNSVGIYLLGGDGGTSSPSGNYSIFDSTGYKAHFGGQIEGGNRLKIGTLNGDTSSGIFDGYQLSAGRGTISVTASGTTVTGSGTAFLYDFNVGDTIFANSESKRITAISSNTSITTQAWSSTFNGSYSLSGGLRFSITGKGCFNSSTSSPLSLAKFFNGSATINNTTINYGIASNINFNNTAAAGSGGGQLFLVSSVLGSNTQNWGDINISSSSARVLSGAAGTVTELGGHNLTVANLSSAATVTRAYGIKAGFSPSQPIGTATAYIGSGLNAATNNIGLYLTLNSGSGVIPPSGNWGIYDETSYSSYHAGRLGIGTNNLSGFGLNVNRSVAINKDSATLQASLGSNMPVVIDTATGKLQRIPASILSGGISNYSHNISTPTTGGTVNLTNNQYNIINPAGALLALTVNLPSSPANNDVVYIKYTQAITTVTYGNGTVVDGITSPVAGGLLILVYDSGTTSWY